MPFLPFFVSLAASFLLGYLLGSIPFGLLLTRAAGTADLRAIGSGNIGATNVLRTGRKDLAAATLLLDAAEGRACRRASALRWAPRAASPPPSAPFSAIFFLSGSNSRAERASRPFSARSSRCIGRRA